MGMGICSRTDQINFDIIRWLREPLTASAKGTWAVRICRAHLCAPTAGDANPAGA